jgi:hypothetical protein
LAWDSKILNATKDQNDKNVTSDQPLRKHGEALMNWSQEVSLTEYGVPVMSEIYPWAGEMRKKKKYLTRYFSIFYDRKPLWFFVILSSFVIFLWLANWAMTSLFIKNSQDRGLFGDSFGSVNAFFTGMAFVGLIATMLLQQKELKLQRRELKLQRQEVAGTREELSGQKAQMEKQNEQIQLQIFENTFFNMLKVLNDFIQEISGPFRKDAGSPRRGRDQLSHLVSKLGYSLGQHTAKSIAESYNNLYEQNTDDLAAYFRILYNICKFVDNSKVTNKKMYTNIVRAQLSQSELILLNCNSRTAHGIGFKRMIDEYDLLKHCPVTYLGVDFSEIGLNLNNVTPLPPSPRPAWP